MNLHDVSNLLEKSVTLIEEVTKDPNGDKTLSFELSSKLKSIIINGLVEPDSDAWCTKSEMDEMNKMFWDCIISKIASSLGISCNK